VVYVVIKVLASNIILTKDLTQNNWVSVLDI